MLRTYPTRRALQSKQCLTFTQSSSTTASSSAGPRPSRLGTPESLLHAEEAGFHAAYWRHRDAYDRGALTARAYWQPSPMTSAVLSTRPSSPA